VLNFIKDLTNSEKALFSLVIMLITWILNRIMLSKIHQHMTDVKRFYHVKKTLNYIAVIIDIILILMIWISQLSAIPTILGLFSAGIAIALKDLFSNIAAWLFILWRRPFEVGDRIAISGVAGDVIDHRLFQFTINEINQNGGDQSTGRIIHIPNAMVFTNALTNYGQGFQYMWSELSVTLTFESNWQRAKKAFLKIAEQHAETLTAEAETRLRESAKKFMIYYSKLTPIVYTSMETSGVVLSIRFLCDPQQKRIINERITEAILTFVEESDDIAFAYATQRLIVDSQNDARKS
jgi:small-conductance mechanosensitive channel